MSTRQMALGLPRKQVACLSCGVYFDLYAAAWCEGHRARVEMPKADRAIRTGEVDAGFSIPAPWTRERCKVCPLGHALHSVPGWWQMKIREPTGIEEMLGFEWVLKEVSA